MSKIAEKHPRFEGRMAVTGEVPVSTVRIHPEKAFCLYAFAHGAGTSLDHAFMEAMATGLAERGVATLRYNFPYREGRGWPPDRSPVLQATVRAALARAAEVAQGIALLAGGKSLGGRMTSTAAAETVLPGVEGLAFLGFPLHPAGKPATDRARHLVQVGLPMLFLQGTRDRLADLDLLEGAVEGLDPPPTLHQVDGADHGFDVLKRSGRTAVEVRDELCDTMAAWARTVTSR